MKAGKEDISGIFNRGWNLIIPFFQRSYVWQEEQWERFLSDMYDICQHKQEYFLGSVILKKVSEDGGDKTIVDGQQRLTTLVLFFKALMLKQNQNQEFDNIFKTRDDKKSIIKHNKNDYKYFEPILNLGLLQKIENPNNQVEKCYNYFIEHIDENELNFNDLLKYIVFVGVTLEPYENEQQIFDTINSLGVKLTTADLLKNLLFKSSEIELYQQYWQELFEKDDETIKFWHKTTNKKDGKTLIDILLFAFLQIKSRNLPPNQRSGFGQISNLLKSYKKFLPHINDKIQLLKELRLCAILFQKYINPDISDERLLTQIDRINLIIFESDLFSIIPYVIFVLLRLQHDEQALNETLFVLESYLLRRMVGIDKSTLMAKGYTDLFGIRLITQDIISAKNLKIHLTGYKNDHLNYIPNDRNIQLLLKNKALTQAKSKLVLYLLDNKIRQDNDGEILFSFNTYHIEYLMPIKWQKSWQQPIDLEMRKLAVRTLGNITLTPQKLNSHLKEADWQTRLNGKNRAKGLKEYNHLSLTKTVLNKDKWTDDDIFANNERLAKRICEIWKLA